MVRRSTPVAASAYSRSATDGECDRVDHRRASVQGPRWLSPSPDAAAPKQVSRASRQPYWCGQKTELLQYIRPDAELLVRRSADIGFSMTTAPSVDTSAAFTRHSLTQQGSENVARLSFVEFGT